MDVTPSFFDLFCLLHVLHLFLPECSSRRVPQCVFFCAFDFIFESLTHPKWLSGGMGTSISARFRCRERKRESPQNSGVPGVPMNDWSIGMTYNGFNKNSYDLPM